MVRSGLLKGKELHKAMNHEYQEVGITGVFLEAANHNGYLENKGKIYFRLKPAQRQAKPGEGPDAYGIIQDPGSRHFWSQQPIDLPGLKLITFLL